jgi:hypothetical protein
VRGGAKSYDGEKAWYNLSHSILSVVPLPEVKASGPEKNSNYQNWALWVSQLMGNGGCGVFWGVCNCGSVK